MEAQIQQLLDTLGDLKEKANANACFGEPVTVEGRTVIPVASVGYGFGVGLGQGPGESVGSEEPIESGGGGGGGMGTRPLGAIEVTSKGTRVKPVVDQQKVTLASILLAGWVTFWIASTLITIFGEREES